MTEAESPFADCPGPIFELAASLVDFVERAIRLRPDFSPETLSLVDHYAVIAREEVKNRPELMDLTAQALGAYFGEVARRSLGAFWQVPSPNFHDWSLCGETAYVMINPIGVGYDALLGTVEHGGPSSQMKLATEDKAFVAARLESLPPVREDEFFTLCTRWEVLEIAMEAARAAASQRGYADEVYTAADYETGLRPLSSY